MLHINHSELYSPSVGPGLRRALSKYDVDCVLDGEMMAWDDFKQSYVNFGSNRTVAFARAKYMDREGWSDPRDKGLHKGEKDKDVIRRADMLKYEKPPEDDDYDNDDEHKPGAECWLKYVVFDVLYVGGPEAEKFLSETFPEGSPTPAGSLIHLDLFERKRILYNLLEEQKDEVEIVQSVVVTSSGKKVDAEKYFSPTQPTQECGVPAYRLDSPKWTLNVCDPSSLEKYDEKRRDDRKDFEISRLRTNAVNEFYSEIVDHKKMEGLVFKDLSSPYVMRSNSYLWLKIKPDFMGDSYASDIDVVVCGASFATGTKRSGKIASFLCACVDSHNTNKYMTL